MTPEAPSIDALLAELVNRPAWHRRAACRGMGTETFFIERGQSTAAATAISAGCEVRSECLSVALEHSDTQGVWGGLSRRGRRVLRQPAA